LFAEHFAQSLESVCIGIRERRGISSDAPGDGGDGDRAIAMSAARRDGMKQRVSLGVKDMRLRRALREKPSRERTARFASSLVDIGPYIYELGPGAACFRQQPIVREPVAIPAAKNGYGFAAMFG
jgi:hypothetical protein